MHNLPHWHMMYLFLEWKLLNMYYNTRVFLHHCHYITRKPSTYSQFFQVKFDIISVTFIQSSCIDSISNAMSLHEFLEKVLEEIAIWYVFPKCTPKRYNLMPEAEAGSIGWWKALQAGRVIRVQTNTIETNNRWRNETPQSRRASSPLHHFSRKSFEEAGNAFKKRALACLLKSNDLIQFYIQPSSAHCCYKLFLWYCRLLYNFLARLKKKEPVACFQGLFNLLFSLYFTSLEE